MSHQTLTPCMLKALFKWAQSTVHAGNLPPELRPVMHSDDMTHLVHQVTGSAITDFAASIGDRSGEENIIHFTHLIVDMFMSGIVAGFILREGLAIGRGEVHHGQKPSNADIN